MTDPVNTDEARAWDRLDAALDRHGAAGRPVALWWRDDDAANASPALERLQALGPIPVAVAVIARTAAPDLAAVVAMWPQATVLQHGYTHTDHAPAGAKHIELGGGRPVDTMVAELAEGRDRLIALFGRRCLPVLVPPWNRIDPGLIPALPALGFRGISTFGPPHLATLAPGAALTEVNTDIDIMDWRNRRFVGAIPVLDALVARLDESRRPIGLLTHHRVHDDAAWRFLARFCAALHNHPAVRWCDAAGLFGPGPWPALPPSGTVS